MLLECIWHLEKTVVPIITIIITKSLANETLASKKMIQLNTNKH